MKRERIATVLMLFLLIASFSYVIGSAVVKNSYLITGMATGVGGDGINASDLCGNGVCNRLNGEDGSNCPADCWCGDGVADDSEECDNGDLSFKSCNSLGYNSGDLGCYNDCTFDTSDCSHQEEEDETCGNGVCESFESCGSCVEDCVWETADCGDNGICYLNRGFGWCLPRCEYEKPSVCVCGEQWLGNAPFGMILNELGPDPHTGCSDENCQGERAYCFVFPENTPLPKPSSLSSNMCSDGSLPGQCSLTRPLYCDSDKELTYDCSICGCGVGYFCGEIGICLIEDEVPIIEGNESVNDSGILWRQLENEYNLIDESARVKELIERGIDEDVLLSSSSIITDVVKIENLQERLEISVEVISSVDDRVKRTSEVLISSDVDEIEELFEVSSDDVFDGRVLKNVIDVVSEDRDGVPYFSPEEVAEASCVDISGGSCLGESECCSGFVCNAGICLSSDDVESVDVPIEEIGGGRHEYGLSNLVNVDIVGANIESVIEYETHPSFIENLDIPDSVNFGFYDIKVSNDVSATLEFDVLNDLLVLNQIVAIGLYRLTEDGWEALDLVDINYDAERTNFKFETSGFSYFTLRGIKEGISFESVTAEDEGLWAVYRRSYTPGFSLVEFFFGAEDTLIFGILNNKPLLDLGLSSGF
jgi:hypothetical protein